MARCAARGRSPAPDLGAIVRSRPATSPSTLALGATLALLHAGGCVLPHTLEWEIGWAETGLDGRAAVLEASIVAGGCDGADVLWIGEAVATSQASWAEPPTLGEGLYGFRARARDERCRWFAGGCRQLRLPGDNDGTVTVMLAAMAPSAACDEDLCIGGRCACSAPGECDACTSGDCSCNASGCAMWCRAEQSCSCVGGDCSLRCDTGSECGCIGGNCVIDCAPGATCECIGGDCRMACAEGASCSCLGGDCR